MMDEKHLNFIFCLMFGRPYMMTTYLSSKQPDNWLKYRKLDVWEEIDNFMEIFWRGVKNGKKTMYGDH